MSKRLKTILYSALPVLMIILCASMITYIFAATSSQLLMSNIITYDVPIGTGTKDDPFLIYMIGSNDGTITQGSFNYYAGTNSTSTNYFASSSPQYYFKQMHDLTGSNFIQTNLLGFYDGNNKSINNDGGGALFNNIGSTSVTTAKVEKLYVSNSNSTAVAGIAVNLYGKIDACSFSGKITASANAGGFVANAYNSSTISNSYNTANITASGKIAGGLIGVANGTVNVTNSYNTGTVSGTTIGGLVGSGATSSTIKLTNSYNYGTVSGTTKGGLIGSGATTTISNSYWFNGCGASSAVGSNTTTASGSGKAANLMQYQSSYSGWTFGTYGTATSGWCFVPAGVLINGSTKKLILPRLWWEKITPLDVWTITYNANGGSGTMAPQKVIRGETTNLIPIAFTPPANKQFTGWSTSPTGSVVYADGASITPTSNIGLYPIWEYKSFAVTLNRAGGSGGTTSTTATYASAMPAITAPTKTGYDFNGYYKDLYAQGNLQLWYDGIYNQGLDSSTSTTATTWKDLVGTNNGTLTNFASGAWSGKGLVFDGSNDFVVGSNIPIKNETTWEIVFKPASTGTMFILDQRINDSGYQPAYMSGGNIQFFDSYTSNDKYITCGIGTSLTTLTIVKNGTSVSIYINGTLKGSKTTNITSLLKSSLYLGTRHTQTGFFNGTMYGLRIYDKVLTTTEISSNYAIDASRFGSSGTTKKYYNANGTSANTCDFTSNVTLMAKWTAKNYTVTLDKQGGTGGTSSVTATYGGYLPSATAPTKLGYKFAGYYTAENGGGTKYYDESMVSTRPWDLDKATTLYANWSANSYTVTLNQQGGTGGTSSVSATYNSAMPAITQPKKTGYDFNGYYKDIYSQTNLQLWYDGIYNQGLGDATNTTATTWKDLVGTNNGTLTNFASGSWSGKGLVFDGSNDYVVGSNMFIENNATWEIVFKQTSVGAYFILDQRISDSGYQPAYINAGSVQFYDSATGGSTYVETGIGTGLTTLTIVKNGTTVNMYVNGVLKGSTTTNVTSSLLSSLYLGTRHTQTGFFKGTMYGLRIYDRVLSAAEISSNYAIDASRFGSSGTIKKYYNADGTSANLWDVASAATLYAEYTAVATTISTSKTSASGTYGYSSAINVATITAAGGGGKWTYIIGGANASNFALSTTSETTGTAALTFKTGANPGTYTCTVTAKSSYNNTIATTGTITVTIGKANLSGSVKITGNNYVGQTLTASVTNTNSATLAYQWYYASSSVTSGGTAISGATSSTYKLTETHIGKYIYVVVSASKTNYNSTSWADVTDATANTYAKTQGTLSGSVSITGSNVVGQTLTASVTNTNSATLGYQWYTASSSATSGGTAISGATSSTYKLTTSEIGKYIYVVVSASKTNYISASWSDVTDATANTYAKTQGTLSGSVSITGSNVVGQTLTASVTNTNSATLAYQWYYASSSVTSGGTAISGATSSTYKLTTTHIGKYIYVIVSGTKTDYISKNWADVTDASANTYAVVNGGTLVGSVSITGSNVVGQTLTASVTNTNSATLTYQWYTASSSATSGGTAISGATSSTYKLTTSEIGKYIYVVVSASKTNYISASWKDVTDATANTYAKTQGTLSGSVSITGSNIVGQTLTASVTNTNSATLAYQWYYASSSTTSGGTAISGATSSTYKLTTTHIGKYIYVIVSGTKTDYISKNWADVTDASANTYAVVNGGTLAGSVSITGTNKVGSTLTASVTNTNSATLAYQWYYASSSTTSGGTAISGATSSTYAPTATYIGKYIYVIVSASKTNYVSTTWKDVTDASANTYAVVNGGTLAGSVSITGTNKVGSTLTASVTNTNSATLAYQWYYASSSTTSGGTAISGATSSTYAPTATYIGKYIYVVVSASKTNYVSTTWKDVTDASANTYAVVNGGTLVGSVKITGNNYVGQTLTASVTNTNSATLTYQWYYASSSVTSGGTAISGATSSTYAPTATYIGKYIYVIVSASKTNYISTSWADVTDATNNTYAYVYGVLSGSVKITGNNYVGQTLTASVTNTNSATLTYQWYTASSSVTSGGTAISGATSSTYKLTTSEIGKYIYVVVSASKTNYISASWKDVTDKTNNTYDYVYGVLSSYVTATAYSGTYNGSAHAATIKSTLAGVKIVSGSSTSYGTTTASSTTANTSYNLTPTRTDVGTTTVYFQATKSGYITYSGTTTVTIKAGSYTVTLDKQGGTGGTSSVTATYGSAMPSATAPTRSGYTFGGYYTGTNGTGTQYYTNAMASARTWNLTSATTLYAKWTSTGYTVTFNANGGSGTMSSQNAAVNTNITLQACTFTGPATAPNFVGWATSSTGSVDYSNGATIKPTSNLNLYAVWSDETDEFFTVSVYFYAFLNSSYNPSDGLADWGDFDEWYYEEEDTSRAFATVAYGADFKYEFSVGDHAISNGGEYEVDSWSYFSARDINLSITDEHPTGLGETLVTISGYNITSDVEIWVLDSHSSYIKNFETYYLSTVSEGWNSTGAINYNKNGGYGFMAESDASRVAQDCKFFNPGYVFKGWATSATGPVAYFAGEEVNTSVKTLYAVWGDPSNVYTISNINEFNNYANVTSSTGIGFANPNLTFRQTANITSSSYKYTNLYAQYDGGGYTFNITGSNLPLFQWIGNQTGEAAGRLYNLNVVNNSLTSTTATGGIAMSLHGEIYNCSFGGEIICSAANVRVGGLVGTATSPSVINCSYNYANITSTGENTYVGGIAGSIVGSAISSCFNVGNINSVGYTGGMVGYMSGSEIRYCYNSGKLSTTGKYLGGIVGYIYDNVNTGAIGQYDIGSDINQSYNLGTLSKGNYLLGNYTGGIVGYAPRPSTAESFFGRKNYWLAEVGAEYCVGNSDDLYSSSISEGSMTLSQMQVQSTFEKFTIREQGSATFGWIWLNNTAIYVDGVQKTYSLPRLAYEPVILPIVSAARHNLSETSGCTYSVSPMVVSSSGTTVTFTATTVFGYKFMGWYSSQTSTASNYLVSTNSKYTCTLTSPTTYYAYWIEELFTCENCGAEVREDKICPECGYCIDCVGWLCEECYWCDDCATMCNRSSHDGYKTLCQDCCPDC